LSFSHCPKTSLYAPFGGEVAELRIAQTQQESSNGLELKWLESGVWKRGSD
jgi:hypothetical protein